MNFFRYTALLLVLLSIEVHAQQSEVRISMENNNLIIENALFRRTLSIGASGTLSAVRPGSYRLKADGKERYVGNPAFSWFELAINGTVVRSNDPLWKYDSLQVVDLKHGGKEAALTFFADSGPATGTGVRYIVQAFPGASMIRERLVLFARSSPTVRMTYMNNVPHLVFPRYEWAGGSASSVRLRELQIARWAQRIIDAPVPETSYDEFRGEGVRENANLSQNYMYHPVRTDTTLANGDRSSWPGPVLFGLNASAGSGWMVAYEHGASDMTGIQEFVRMETETGPDGIAVGIRHQRGAYFSNQSLNDTTYATLWTTTGFYPGSTFNDGEHYLWDYLLRWINDEPASREPLVYYNTWGMQRDEQIRGKNVHGVLTMDRIRKELDAASEMGVQMFVLDDGWQKAFGDWEPHPQRFPQGIAPLKRELDRRNMMLGIWMAPIHTDSFSTVGRSQPDWLIRDRNGKPTVGRWNKNELCLESGYYDYFIRACKRLIDAGALHFKWDGVDTDHPCADPRHRHGGSDRTPEERQDRYAYEYVRFITRAIAELKAYNPNVVIEFDATEPDRTIGLSILSEAKYFWMNNGASWYGDRSPYRVKSMRMVPNLYHDIIPPVLQSAANYPHNESPYRTQRYAIATSLLGGLGIWGDLSTLTPADRRTAAELINLGKRVTRTVSTVRPIVSGSVGSSPEMYTYVDSTTAEGQVIGFSGSAMTYLHRVDHVHTPALLAVIRNAYSVDSTGVRLPFSFAAPDVAREAFFLSNGGSGVRILSSTSWLRDAQIRNRNELVFIPGAPGRHIVQWPSGTRPTVRGTQPVETEFLPGAPSGTSLIQVTTRQAGTEVTITGVGR